ncbi:MAG: aminotransferase class I/II-fold pyridoxal phosphate-dependent enzyme [Candidatus Pacebacteria bacterium]|nr:aminotransferase class I/II-fold pyridoxal phosphate-dependent enzyme [Candidatus Paceibacterota bacterium]
MAKNTNKYFEKYLKFLNKHGLYPAIYTVEGPSSSPEVFMDNKKFFNFSSNNYLGLAGNEEVKKVVIENIKKYGVGSGSTRLLSGTLDIQVKFEEELARFLEKDDSITFSSGFLANVGVIRMLVDSFPYFTLIFGEKPGIIISDKLNHASIIDGVRLAKSERAIYEHNNMEDLERILEENRNKRKLILTDGIFSMDGDLAKLKEISELADAYEAVIMVDDSHGVGVLGPYGRGTAYHLGVAQNIDVIMGSFTKAFGSIGGFIASNKSISDYLRITARSYIFSDPIIPAVVAGLIETTKIIKEGDNLRKNVIGLSSYLRENLKKLGFTVLGEETPIVPLFIGSEKKAIKFSAMLYENNILAPCIRRPAVIEGSERIRFSLMATHNKEQVDYLLEVCERIGRSNKII